MEEGEGRSASSAGTPASDPPSIETLADRLDQVGTDVSAATVAVWTWLDARRGALSGADEDWADEVRAASRDGETSGWDWHIESQRLRAASDGPRAAADLLARIERTLVATGRLSSLVQVRPVEGIDGQSWVIMPRDPWIADRCWGDGRNLDAAGEEAVTPQDQQADPLEVLAPRLSVEPAAAKDIDLVPLVGPADPSVAASRSYAAAQAHLAEIRSLGPGAAEAAFAIHMSALGAAPLSGLERRAKDFVLHPPPEPQRRAEAVANAVEAIEVADEGRATFLVLPELGFPADPDDLAVLRRALRKAARPPAMTVVGLFHAAVGPDEPPEVDGVVQGAYANEAVVLGPDGTEIFRHRKLSRFALKPRNTPVGERRPGDLAVAPPEREPARLRRLEATRLVGPPMEGADPDRPRMAFRVLTTEIGPLAVAICLDLFARAPSFRLRSSPTGLLLVASLSSTVAPHENAAADLTNTIGCVTVVCNRSNDPPRPGGEEHEQWTAPSVRSFWAAPRAGQVWRTVPGQEYPPGDLTSKNTRFRLADSHDLVVAQRRSEDTSEASSQPDGV